ncbi:MAG TPA: DUF4893 domain-containing protein [Allosphingosinicella sp.]|jgi:hypothetical protein|nr:DUF4893 domain-containing protein [Allosphingosinicella sp.]
MPRRLLIALTIAAAGLSACTAPREGPASAVPLKPLATWRTVATRDDHVRISDWRKAWVKALATARPGHEADVAAEGPLLDPDAGLDRPMPPPGEYRCRTIKLGSQSTVRPNYVVYPSARCRIDVATAGTLTFAQIGGAQRPRGRLFPDTSRRAIFLGTLQLGDEPGTLRYGHDKLRDLAALVERVGDRRWRMVFPNPHFESTLDVIELVPAG